MPLKFVLLPLTNNPEKVNNLRASGFDVAIESLEPPINQVNRSYLKTKAERLGHLRKVE